MLLINPARGDIITVDGDPQAYYAMGYRDPTRDELLRSAREEEFGTAGQQAQAQVERVVRGATLGAVEGFGDTEDIRARAEVSEELSPVTSFAASVLPDVGVAALTGGLGGLATGAGRAAGRAALAEGAGLARAGLAAARAGGAATLAGESLGGGAVAAGQEAYAEGREFADDPGRFAEDLLFWGGLNFGLGAAALRGTRAAAAADEVIPEESLDDIAKAAEARAVPEAAETAADAAPAPAAPFSLAGKSIDDLGAGPWNAETSNPEALQKLLDSPEFAATGRVPKSVDEWAHERGVTVFADESGKLELEDGRHRFMAARQLGLPSVYGTVKDAGSGKILFKGDIPIGNAPSATRAPLNDVHLPDAEGMLNAVAPDDPRLATVAAELDQLRAEGIAGMSLRDLRALELDQGPGAAESAAKVAAFEADETFLREGMLASNNDRGRGGLPVLTLYDGVSPSLTNGRHRLTAARRANKEEIIFNVQKFDAEGEPLWDYVGPVRIKAAPVADGAVRQGEREAVEAGVERALRNASKSDADDIVEQVTRATEPVKEADSFGRQRRLYINRGPILEVAAREMQQDLSKVVKDVQEVTRLDKLSSVAANVSDNIPAQKSAARVISEDAAKFAGELRAEAKAYGAAAGKQGLQYAIPGQKSWTIALMDHAKEIQQAETGKALFEALDGFKRSAQDFKLSLETGALNSVNPIHHQKLIPRIDAFAQRIRATLEDANTWGRAGDMQRAYNAVIHDQLLPSMRVFEEAVLKKTHKGYDGLWNTEGWETKISALLKGENAGNRRHVGAVLDAMDQLASVRRQYGDAKTATRIEDGTAKVRRTIGLADEVQDATERMTALGELVGGVPYGGAIAGGLAGGLPGAAIGAALPGAVRGIVLGDLVAAYQRLSGATELALQRGVDDWIRSSRLRGSGIRVPKVLQLSDEAKQLRDVAARRGVSQTMALFLGDEKTPHAAFTKMRDALLDQEKFLEQLGADYDALAREDPDTFMMVAGRASLARQFLIDRMPPNVAVSMANPEGFPPSRESVEDWAEYVNAVRYPTRILRNLGAITQRQVEVLRTVYPRLHELAQQRVIEGIGRAQAAGEKLDDTFMVRAALLFPDLDGLGSPVFSREYGKAVREYNMAQQQAQMQRPGSGGELKKPKPAPLNAIIQDGATFGTG